MWNVLYVSTYFEKVEATSFETNSGLFSYVQFMYETVQFIYEYYSLYMKLYNFCTKLYNLCTITMYIYETVQFMNDCSLCTKLLCMNTAEPRSKIH